VGRYKYGGNEMKFKDLKVTITKVEGNCSRSQVGTTFFVKNAKFRPHPISPKTPK